MSEPEHTVQGWCDAPWTLMVAMGEVGPDLRATCPRCGKRIHVAANRYAHHKAAPPEELAAARRARRRESGR